MATVRDRLLLKPTLQISARIQPEGPRVHHGQVSLDVALEVIHGDTESLGSLLLVEGQTRHLTADAVTGHSASCGADDMQFHERESGKAAKRFRLAVNLMPALTAARSRLRVIQTRQSDSFLAVEVIRPHQRGPGSRRPVAVPRVLLRGSESGSSRRVSSSTR